MKTYIGKRILVMWTTAAFNRGSDWPAFRVIDADEKSMWCHGVDAPDGTPHDGSKCSINEGETLMIWEWKEGA